MQFFIMTTLCALGQGDPSESRFELQISSPKDTYERGDLLELDVSMVTQETRFQRLVFCVSEKQPTGPDRVLRTQMQLSDAWRDLYSGCLLQSDMLDVLRVDLDARLFCEGSIPLEPGKTSIGRIIVHTLTDSESVEIISFVLGDCPNDQSQIVISEEHVVNPSDVELSLALQRRMFIRADSNMDSVVDISDAISTLDSLFVSGSLLRCENAADANDDNKIDISDAVHTLNFLFQGGPEMISAPFPDKGYDQNSTTEENTGCGGL